MASTTHRPQNVEANSEAATSNSREAFEKLLESYSQPQQLHDGAMMKGRVIRVTDSDVIVDVGHKLEGLVPIAQFKDRDGVVTVKPGDEVDVTVERRGDREGYVTLSHEKAARVRVWDDLEKAFNDQTPIIGRVLDRIKGGLAVDFGVRAFLPGSQVDVKPIRNLDSLKGQDIEVKVIKFNRRRGNVVVSRKVLIEEESNARKAITLTHLAEGAVVRGVIKNMTDYGAFVDLGGLDGLLHVTDMSWGRANHPSDVVQVGEEVDLLVLKFDREKERVALGLKQLYPDPWHDADTKYAVGTKIKGKVVNVTDYGAFVELEQGIEGLVHVSEMTWSKRMKHPSKLVNVGDQVDCVVLNVNPAERRISLGMRQLATNPWDSLHEKFPVGMTVEGRVRNLTDFGAFIEIEEGIDGLVHVSNLSWTKRVKHPSEVLKKGDRVKAIILAIEPDKRRLSLGVKQLQPDVWESFFQAHHVGDVVHGKVLRVAAFGAFVEIAEGVEGLCHKSEAVDGNGQPLHLEPGAEHEFKIIKMTPEEKKVGLSIRAVGEEASRSEVEAYKQPVSSTSSTIGELISWKRASNENN